MTEKQYADMAEEIKTVLYRTAFMYLGDEDAAMEAVDEAIYKGFISHRRLRKPEYFKTWMTRILMNVCISELRRKKRLASASELPEDSYEMDSLPLKEAIARLPREMRNVIILRFFSGLTLDETAEVLKVPVGTVSTWQRRALQILRLEIK